MFGSSFPVRGKQYRSTIGRNWLTGQALDFLPAGQAYDLRIEAIGWNSRITKHRLLWQANRILSRRLHGIVIPKPFNIAFVIQS